MEAGVKTLDIPDAAGHFALPRGWTVLGFALAAWAVVGGAGWTLLVLAFG